MFICTHSDQSRSDWISFNCYIILCTASQRLKIGARQCCEWRCVGDGSAHSAPIDSNYRIGDRLNVVITGKWRVNWSLERDKIDIKAGTRSASLAIPETPQLEHSRKPVLQTYSRSLRADNTHRGAGAANRKQKLKKRRWRDDFAQPQTTIKSSFSVSFEGQ